MVKGTPSMGKKSGKITHIHCRRCGQKAFHRNKHKCSSCGYGKSAKLRTYSWKKEGK